MSFFAPLCLEVEVSATGDHGMYYYYYRYIECGDKNLMSMLIEQRTTHNKNWGPAFTVTAFCIFSTYLANSVCTYSHVRFVFHAQDELIPLLKCQRFSMTLHTILHDSPCQHSTFSQNGQRKLCENLLQILTVIQIFP